MTVEYSQDSYDSIYEPPEDFLNNYDNSLTKFLYPDKRKRYDLIRKFIIESEYRSGHVGKFIEMKDMNTIYSSLLFENMLNVEFRNCNIGINNEIPESYQRETGIMIKNNCSISINNSSIDYPVVLTSNSNSKHNYIKESILDTFGIHKNASLFITLESSYIENLIINSSISHIYIKEDTTIKNLYVSESNIEIFSPNASDSMIENIYCLESYLRFQKEGDQYAPTFESSDDILNDKKERMKSNTKLQTSFYKGDIDAYNCDVVNRFYGICFDSMVIR